MATALSEHCEHLDKEKRHLQELVSILLSELRQYELDFIVNGSENRIPGSLSLSFPRVEGELLLHRLDLMGSAVATGSACDSMSTILSHVIQAIKVPDEYAYGTIRITLGMDNSAEQMQILASQINKIMCQIANKL